MRRGAKRMASSDSNPSVNESLIKRVTFGAAFDTPRAEPSQPQIETNGPTLDKQRAESSRQHVRALNTQFASWVKAQLENHSDELWEDGVRDYLNHSSSIMEKFSDVVNWLRANAAKAESTPFPTPVSVPKIFSFETVGKDNNQIFEKPGNSFTSSTSFGSSFGSGSLFNNTATPFSFGLQNSTSGNQNSIIVNHNDATVDVDDDPLEQPSSPSVKRTEEKGVSVVHEVKCKLYVKSSDPTDKNAWKDRGTGQLSIRCNKGVDKGTRESKPTILIRNDVGKLLLNALIYPGIKTSMQKNAIVAIFHTSAEIDNNDTVVAQTCLIRTKTEEDRDKLAQVIQDYAPTAS